MKPNFTDLPFQVQEDIKAARRLLIKSSAGISYYAEAEKEMDEVLGLIRESMLSLTELLTLFMEHSETEENRK